MGTRAGVNVVLDGVCRDAVAREVPTSIVEKAAAATHAWARRGRVRNERRLAAYFWAVVRRAAFHEREGSNDLQRRFLVASLVQDLRDGGVDERRIRAEVERCFGDIALDAMSPAAA